MFQTRKTAGWLAAELSKEGHQVAGTVLDWCSKLKFIDPKKIKVFVLDEADVMIATQGHQDQSIRIQR